jgi:hypothetical protein
MLENGFAVAFRKDGKKFHVRAVRLERVLEGEGDTISKAVFVVHEKAKALRARSRR